jgi:hypothetical protein
MRIFPIVFGAFAITAAVSATPAAAAASTAGGAGDLLLVHAGMAGALRCSLPITADALIGMPIMRMAIRIAHIRRLLAERIVWRTTRIAAAPDQLPHLT